ncbi:hypothetical protein ABZ858_19235 [Streptomyces sp. NPDC047017]|uniref:hypothetical protein n=1 Tax=Streptomyces sp. NPDC047017 TaxID=3155024 RepID=UPI003411BEB5
MGSLRLTLCAGLLAAGAFAPVAGTTAVPAADGPPAAVRPASGGRTTAVPALLRPAPAAPHAVASAPGRAHAVTEAVLAGAAAAAVLLLPRGLGAARPGSDRSGRRPGPGSEG